MRAAQRLSWSAVGLALALTAAAPTRAAEDRLHLVACAPGYPGSTEQAQPTMDDFAALIAAASGRPVAAVTAEYHETEDGGLERLRLGKADLALVPLAFFLKHEQELGLSPLLQLVQESGSAREVWSLVAPAGRVTSPDSLAGWELIAIPAYAPAFLGGPVLGAWGGLPPGVTLTFSRRVLAGLRRVMAGEEVAVLLDGAQTAALAALPGGEALEVVAESPPLLAGLLVTVGDGISVAAREGLAAGMLGVHERGDFDEILDTLRLVRFEALDGGALDEARRAYRSAAESLAGAPGAG